jgi:3-phenylpropionate/trans-cinnamate dioxygenase ferredoxin subunit
MSKKYVVAAADTIRDGDMQCFTVDQKRIIVAHIAGEFHAFDEMCSHEDYPLLNGALRKDHVECPLHGSRFCLRTGQPMEEPATTPIKIYPLEIIDGKLYVELENNVDVRT